MKLFGIRASAKSQTTFAPFAASTIFVLLHFNRTYSVAPSEIRYFLSLCLQDHVLAQSHATPQTSFTAIPELKVAETLNGHWRVDET